MKLTICWDDALKNIVLFNLIDDLSTHSVIDPTYDFLEHEQRICATGKSHSQ